jgi:N-acyl amino acid synthase FeeM
MAMVTFLVASDRTAVGTLTLGLDGPLGLRAEAAYGEIIERFRRAGNRVCELTRLAVAESNNSKAVLTSLFSLAHVVGRTTHDVTDVFIEVNPRHVGFYSRVLGFVVGSGEKFCERVRAPSVLLQLEVEALEARLGLVDIASLMQPVIAEAA